MADVVRDLLDAVTSEGFSCCLATTPTGATLVTCDPDSWWRAMPAQTVRQAIARHVTCWAGVLAKAGYGVETLTGHGQPHALLVTAPAAFERTDHHA